MQLLAFILICYGLTQIICYGKIFDGIRPYKESLYGLGNLFHCSMCMGFHVGYAVYILAHYSSLAIDLNFVDALFAASVSSGTSYALDKLLDDSGIRVRIK